MADTEVVDLPPLPDSATVSQVAGIVRHILTTLAGMGIFASVTISDSSLMLLCSMGVWLATIGWSLWQKYQAHKTVTVLHTVATAAPATPGGQGNA